MKLVLFIATYPAWVQYLVVMWVLLSALLVIVFIMARPGDPLKYEHHDEVITFEESTGTSQDDPVRLNGVASLDGALNAHHHYIAHHYPKYWIVSYALAPYHNEAARPYQWINLHGAEVAVYIGEQKGSVLAYLRE